MKITFEGTYYEDILTQMANVLAATARQSKSTTNLENVAAAKPAKAQGPGPQGLTSAMARGLEPHVDKPVEKSGKTRTPKQLENDAKLRERALAKKAAGLKPFDKTPKAAPVEKPVPPPATAESLGMDPAEVVRLRTKTIEDLQTAYANGHQQEVFELLSRFGNGAKSFRELPADAFVPIREAIDNGALT